MVRDDQVALVSCLARLGLDVAIYNSPKGWPAWFFSWLESVATIMEGLLSKWCSVVFCERYRTERGNIKKKVEKFSGELGLEDWLHCYGQTDL